MKTNKTTKAKSFKCKRCGRCCLKYGNMLQASEKESKMWKRQGRQDILSRTKTIKVGNGLVVGYDLWYDPRTDKNVSRCPFLRKAKNKPIYTCTIHDIKPKACKNYPVTKSQAIKVSCRGYGD